MPEQGTLLRPHLVTLHHMTLFTEILYNTYIASKIILLTNVCVSR